MTYHDLVMEAMHADPGRTWTAGELTQIIYPELQMGTKQYQARVGTLHNVLKSAAKYKLVELVGSGPRGHIWRLTE